MYMRRIKDPIATIKINLIYFFDRVYLILFLIVKAPIFCSFFLMTGIATLLCPLVFLVFLLLDPCLLGDLDVFI